MAFTQIKTNLIANSAITQEKIDPLVELGGGSSVTTSNTAPVSPSSGDMWYNTINGKLYVYYNSNWVEGQPAYQGIGSRVVDVFTASANQVTFTTSSGYSIGYVDVYINGIKILPADFTATNATTITLGEVSDANDEIVIISWTLAPGIASFVSDIFTANGAQTSFTLSTTPSDENQTTVVIDGVTQIRDTYSVNGSLLTFSESPSSNSVIEVTTARSSGVLTSSYNDLTDKPDLTGLGIKISNIQVTDSGGTVLDDTAVDTAGGYIKLTGAGFVSGCQVLINNVPATSVTFVNSTTVRAQVPATAAGTYIVYLVNPDGGVGIRVNGVTFSSSPSWVTGSSLSGLIDTEISIQLSATDASTYTLQAGSTLPTGLTLTSGGLLSGTVTGLSEETIYNFTIVASDPENQDSPRAFSITITVSDPNFKLTTLAINADVNTFVRDASSNNFPVTITGDTKPSAFSPYNTNWSNLFDGTGDYLGWSGTTLSGNFTVECWVFKTAVDASGYTNVFTGTGNQQFFIDNTTAGSIGLIIGGSVIIPVSGTAVTLNAWHHLAWVREGSTCRAYVNGVQQGTGSSSASFSLNVIGRFDTGGYEMNGYISNARIVNGTCLYPSGTTFTPSTTPLTPIANTSLLTCQSNRLIDNSNNAFTITKNGDTKVVAFGPFTETDTTTGSAYFDGTGDYLTLLNNSAFDLGSGDATIEAWIYPTTSGQTCGIFDKRSSGANYSQFPQIALTSGAFIAYVSYTGSSWAGTINGATPTVNAWTHVAFVRNGNTWTLYVNGSVSGTPFTAAGSVYTSTDSLVIGASTTAGVNPFTGYITNARIIKGTAVYTSAFTPPTAALTAVANTSLLTLQTRQPVNNHSFIDHSGNNNLLTRVGNVSQGSFSPYSPVGWSNYLDGTGDYLTFSATSTQIIGQTSLTSTSTFTIEAWIHPLASSGASNSGLIIGDMSPTTSIVYWVFGPNNSNLITFYWFDGAQKSCSGNTSIPLNTWSHVAISISSGAIKMFVNGVLQTLTGTTTLTNATGSLNAYAIGSNNNSAINAYISNLRIVKSALYSTTFTPSTSALTAVANTSLLTCQSNRFNDNSTANNGTSFTITKTGDARVTIFSPFTSTAAYSPAIHGGSAYFDGSGDYVFNGQGFNTSLGTANWTAEGWIYLTTSSSSNQYILWHYGSSIDVIAIYCRSDTGVVYAEIRATNLSSTTLTASTAFAKYGQWVHVALVRESTTSVKLYTNGVLAASATIAATGSFNETSLSTLRYGAASNPDQLYTTGYLSDWRFIKGRAVYTGAFTPPTSSLPLTADAVHQPKFNNAGIIDVTNRSFFETIGDAKIVTNDKKYGTGSMYFDGTGDYLKGIVDNTFNFGTGDFTIECWVNVTNYSSERAIFYKYVSWATNADFALRIDGSTGLVRFLAGDNTPISITSNSAISTGTWVHIAVTRASGVTKLFVNGTQQTSTHTGSVSIPNDSTNLAIGADLSGSSPFLGYIDDIRITRNVARYTANFTPPTSTFITR